jgi:Polyketide cyclase / dehydrase and lipid transport
MTLLKKLLLAVMVIPIAIIILSLFLPSKYRVERTVVMRAKADAVYAHVSTLKHWPDWTAWTTNKYPDMKNSFSGPESGVGATYHWEGQSSGSGVLKLIRVEPGKRLDYELNFENGKHVSTGAIVIEPEGETLKVTWFNEGSLGWNPVSRIFGLLMDGMMGPDFEEGLRKLQQRFESK